MRVPWSQIVQLMPQILDVSRELLRRTREPVATAQLQRVPSNAELEERVALLEENEQRQAELSTRMADQLAQLTTAVTVLHRLVRWLVIGQVVTAIIAITAVVLALRH
jgi:hypothetical protein